MTGPADKATWSQRVFAGFLRRTDDVNHRMYADRKRAMFQELSGRVIEIGPGTGVNLPYYPKNIEWTGIEPNPVLHPLLERKGRECGLNVNLSASLTEAAGRDGPPADFVVSTLVLCSVRDLPGMLKEIRAALKPGGKFFFIEHVLDRHNPWRRLVQRIVPYTPWRFFSDGCDPGRDIAAAIGSAGFTSVQCQTYAQDGPGLVTLINRPHIYGWAQR